MKNTKQTFFRRALALAIGAAFVSTFGVIANAGAQSASSDAESARPQKKLIELGWDIPTTDYIRDHWEEMEANAPFNGVIYDLTSRPDSGSVASSQSLFSTDTWTRSDLEKNIDDLNSCDFRRFHHNFIRINFYPAKFSWSDDASWKIVCEKAADCAWVARETNGGICLDFESYGATIFKYNVSAGLTFDETRAIVRKRGAEFCQAIVGEYPEVVLLCLWLNSNNMSAGRSTYRDFSLIGEYYGLLPAFINGMLDAVAPETTLVDGCENGYYMNGVAEYDRAAVDMLSLTGPCAALVAPENLSKYRKQVQAGFGFYLDMYTNPPESIYYRAPQEGETRFDRLAANLNAAWNAADEYVWVYGEKQRWWAPEDENAEWTSWEELLPGLCNLQEKLSDPMGVLLKTKESFENNTEDDLVKNGDFTEQDGEDGLANWGTWKLEDTTGEFLAVDNSAVIKDAVNACYIQEIPVESNASYFICGKIKSSGNVVANLSARWQDGDRKWVSQAQDVRIPPVGEVDEDGFQEAFDIARVPEDAKYLVILLGVSTANEGATATFDDIRAYRCK